MTNFFKLSNEGIYKKALLKLDLSLTAMEN